MSAAGNKTAPLHGVFCVATAQALGSESLRDLKSVVVGAGGRFNPAAGAFSCDVLFTSGSGLAAAFLLQSSPLDDDFVRRLGSVTASFRHAFVLGLDLQSTTPPAKQLGRAVWMHASSFENSDSAATAMVHLVSHLQVRPTSPVLPRCNTATKTSSSSSATNRLISARRRWHSHRRLLEPPSRQK